MSHSLPSNAAILTRSHKAITSKKRAKKDQIKEILFDDDARSEFLTGFHKRKLAKADAARKKAIEREKQERLESRREQRQMLRERAVENAAEVEAAYGALAGNTEPDSDDEWKGLSGSKGKEKEDKEYEDEEMLATVTVVEDFDPDSFIHGPKIATPAGTPAEVPRDASGRRIIAPTPASAPARASSSKFGKASSKKAASTKARKVRYETKDARRVERTKQRARRTEKAELAGGKSSRTRGPGGGKSKKRRI